MKTIICLTSILVLLCSSGCMNIHQRYENLKNPTEYLFNSTEATVMETLRDSKRLIAPPPEPLHGAFWSKGDVVYSFGVYDHYTKRYWTGKVEKEDEVDPPEAGRIGTIQARFEVRVMAKAANQTLVSIASKNFEQIVARRYSVFPHFHKGPVFVDVKSDTYFEYLFLLKLGELLGETNMPPIKGRAD